MLGPRTGPWGMHSQPSRRRPAAARCFAYVHEISQMQGHHWVFNRPYVGHSIRSCARSQTTRIELPSEHVHCRRRAKLERCQCHPANSKRISVDRHGRGSESIQRKTFRGDLFSGPKINATRHRQHAGGRTRWRSMDWYQRRAGPYLTAGVGPIRPVPIGLLSSWRGYQ
jgi:hypothetical protein